MKLKRFEGPVNAGYSFWCAGCKECHMIVTEAKPGYSGPTWSFNGDVDRPVISPSILVTSGHHCRGFKPGDSCWCTANAEEIAAGREPYSYSCGICHTFIGYSGAQPGQIVYLNDCTHALAGQTIDLPEIPNA